MTKESDSRIWQQFKNGEEKAFSYIFDAYHLQLFEYGLHFTPQEDVVRDSIQDLFFELAIKKDKLSDTDNILFYLLKSLRQKIFRNLKGQNFHHTEIKEEVTEDFRLEYSNDFDPEEKELRLDQLTEAINQLPARQKETIYLKYYKNLTNTEVAEIMQVNYQSVGNALQKAIQKLRSVLNHDSGSIILFLRTYLR